MTSDQLNKLSKKIAYITINPRGKALQSVQKGFKDFGLEPEYLIYVKPTDRLKKEFKKYKLSFFKEFLVPQIKKLLGKKTSFGHEEINITIPNTITVSKLNSDETLKQIQSLGIKYLINCGAGIFRKKIIELPNLIILNAHAGKLPNYKNMNVVEWAICNEEKVIASVHQIDEGIDSGPLFIEEEVDVSGKKTLIEARQHAFDQVMRMMGKAVFMNEKGEITPKHHNEREGKKWYRMHSFYQKRVTELLNK